jgi:hypothetical protein
MARHWVPLPHHTATVDEILEVLWSDWYGAALIGDDGEIALLPRARCRLEVIETAPTRHHEVDLLLPGQMIRHHRSRWALHWFELPGRARVGLWHLVGFKLRLPPDVMPPVPDEDAILRRVNGPSVEFACR